jgi:hypothetical protein
MPITDFVEIPVLLNLPTTPRQGFLKLLTVAYERYMELANSGSYAKWGSRERLNYEFMASVCEVAQEMSFTDLSHFNPEWRNYGDEVFFNFIDEVQGLISRFVIQETWGQNRAGQGVRLIEREKAIIRAAVAQLRERVRDSSLSDALKKKILSRLDNIELELLKPRFDTATVAWFLLTAATVPGGIAQTIELVWNNGGRYIVEQVQHATERDEEEKRLITASQAEVLSIADRTKDRAHE